MSLFKSEVTGLPFELVVPGDKFELRHYGPEFTARIATGSTLDEAAKGVRALSAYLTGDNFKQLSIGGTKYFVIALRTGHWEVSTPLPGYFSFNNVPRPVDDRIHFSMVAPEKRAVIKFHDPANGPTLVTKIEELLSWVEEKGMIPVQPPLFIYRDDQLTLPFFHKNEIHLALE